MKKSLFLWQIIGFVFIGLLGVILHFAYDWSKANFIFALFSAVNESIFQHIKLFFFPAFLFAVIENKILKGNYKNILCAKLTGILRGMVIIPVLYYTYTGIFGKSADWFNIVIFFIATAISLIYEYRRLNAQNPCLLSDKSALVALCIIAVLLMILTFFPPHIPLFQDPLTKLYGA